MGEIDLTGRSSQDASGAEALTGLLGKVSIGGAAALMSSVTQKASLLPISQKVGEVGGSLWERSSLVRSITAVLAPPPLHLSPFT